MLDNKTCENPASAVKVFLTNDNWEGYPICEVTDWAGRKINVIK